MWQRSFDRVVNSIIKPRCYIPEDPCQKTLMFLIKERGPFSKSTVLIMMSNTSIQFKSIAQNESKVLT